MTNAFAAPVTNPCASPLEILTEGIDCLRIVDNGCMLDAKLAPSARVSARVIAQ